MIHNTKCECGHQNYVGTVLCEACGKPMIDEQGTSPLEMRYDGVARRSQKDNPSWIDRIWNFFSSVKIAIYLIFITLICAAVGTILPQENVLLEHVNPEKYYANEYGWIGTLYYTLGLSNTFESWWFTTLVLMIGTSLVICSLDRVLPLYRALGKQKIRKHLQFLKRQKVVLETPLQTIGIHNLQDAEQWTENLAKQMRKRHYRVTREGTALLAEKHRFSRWGPYINHIGLIIFLLAVLMRGIPGWYLDKELYILEGETKRVPGTEYYMKAVDFTIETYAADEMSAEFREKGRTVAKMFETEAILYECLENCGSSLEKPVLNEIHKYDIVPNHPMKYGDLLVYQFGYEETPQLVSVKVDLEHRETGEAFGEFQLSMLNPDQQYTAGPYTIKLNKYYPDFAIEDGKPVTKSKEPKAPAFIFTISGPKLEKGGEVYMYFPLPKDKAQYGEEQINTQTGSTLAINVRSMDNVEFAEYTTFLNVRVDKALPYMLAGGILFMIGVVMGLYWQHRRIWVRIDDLQLTLGAHTNKNWFGMRKDTALILSKSGLELDPKSLDNGVKP
jgi:cytochrome c biogenesis protein